MIDNLVIGGGLAGSSVAIRLAGAGRSVVLLEREAAAHDKVCGEFLSWEAVAYLRALGLSPETLSAVEVDHVRLFKGRREPAAPLPFRGLSLSRRVLDEALLQQALACGVQVRRGVRATDIGKTPEAWRVTSAKDDSLSACHVFLATGKHDIRGCKRPPGRQSDLVGFKLHWRLSLAQAAALNGAVELHLFRGGYAGLEPVEGGRANLCLVIRKVALRSLGGSWPAVLNRLCEDSPVLAERLAGAQALGEKPLAISSIPYGYVRGRGDGLWRLGDQAAVIPSFSGEGMSIALHSAALAASCRLQDRSADDYQRTLARQVRGQVGRATLVSQILVREWGQTAATIAAQAFPALIAAVASGTRLPASAVDEELRPTALAAA